MRTTTTKPDAERSACNSQHTPGAWHVVSAQRTEVVKTSTGQKIALITNDKDAPLIAAAPDFYDDCRAVLPWLSKAIEKGAFKDCALPFAPQKLLEKIQADLAKVEGGQ